MTKRLWTLRTCQHLFQSGSLRMISLCMLHSMRNRVSGIQWRCHIGNNSNWANHTICFVGFEKSRCNMLHLTGLRLSKSHAALALEFEIYYLFICRLRLSKSHVLVHNIFVIFIIFLFDNMSIYYFPIWYHVFLL